MTIAQRVRARLTLEKRRTRMDKIESILAGHTDRLKAQRALIDNQAQRARKQHERIAALREKVEAAEQVASQALTSYAVLEHQIASMETRVDRLVSQANESTSTSTESERAEGRTLVDEIREEHSRIRARFGIMVRYEERIRRLEAALKPTPGA